tara:strand:- start:968 stop:1354 length:387 start_codon:yes stop_codon:yes gene_type:complete
MKSFNQYISEGPHYGDKNDVNKFDGSEKSVQTINSYLGSISEREFMNADAAVHQIYSKLSSMGMDFKVPASEGQSGSHTIEVVQVPSYGKTGAEAPDEITEDEMNKFSMTVKYEQIPNGMYKVSANIN